MHFFHSSKCIKCEYQLDYTSLLNKCNCYNKQCITNDFHKLDEVLKSFYCHYYPHSSMPWLQSRALAHLGTEQKLHNGLVHFGHRKHSFSFLFYTKRLSRGTRSANAFVYLIISSFFTRMWTPRPRTLLHLTYTKHKNGRDVWIVVPFQNWIEYE